QVWVPALSERDDMEGVVRKALRVDKAEDVGELAGPILDFVWWFNNEGSPRYGASHGLSLSVRDILAWCGFITNLAEGEEGEENHYPPWRAYVQGISLILLDGMGLGSGLSPSDVQGLRKAATGFIISQVPEGAARSQAALHLSGSAPPPHITIKKDERTRLAFFGSDDFSIPWGGADALPSTSPCLSSGLGFSLGAPTTGKNAVRVLRAMQLKKAVLLEGSPGVGKTSLVEAIANASGNELVRINLSEQTDVSDLFGSDLPVPDTDGHNELPSSITHSPEQDEPKNDHICAADGSSTRARFEWCDGVFLKALKAGKWVLLDELNLASQVGV
ncbi:unnamed protein product, partial [Discosporangium mesarthrocarpum]